MNIALLGYGTVGSGVYELINKNKAMVKDIYNKEIKVTKILVRNTKKYEHLKHNKLFVDNFEAIKNENIDILISVMGGLHPAYEYVKYALENKINVITANKDLIAEYFQELINLAQKNNVNLNYEASVAGGIPILKTIKNYLQGNKIESLYGIINGTTNFILSQMYDNEMNYNDVLKIAQDKGFAEADPTSDVEGLDASRKLAILSMLTFDVDIPWEKIKAEGITKIDKSDINYAKQLDKKIKLLGISKISENGIYLSVRPVYIHKQNALSKIDNEFNGIYLESKLTGDLMFYGKGAGKFPTASSIFGDLLDIIQHIEKRNYYYKFKEIDILENYPEKTDWFIRIKSDKIPETTQEIFKIFKNFKLDLKTNNDDMEVTIKLYNILESSLIDQLEKLTSKIKNSSYKYFLILNKGDENDEN